jgi:signal transduction histidine kinase/CheY-like chemotaxis protein
MLQANQVINFSDVADIPNRTEQELLAAQNIKSILAVPLFVAQKFYGFIGFNECRAYRKWGEREVQMLLSTARIIANTIERKQLAEQLVQQERLAAVGHLAAGVAHDFNNILAVMLGFAEILRSSPNTPPTSYNSLGQIITAGQQASHLVRQILDFSQKTIRRPVQINLETFLKESVQFLEHTLPENIRLDLQIEPGQYFIEADSTQFQQLLTNLAINARDAILPNSGRLQIGLSHTDERGTRICTLCQQQIEGRWLRLSVSDNGHGIAPDALPRILEPFFTTKVVGKGVGLGLSQVAGIIAQHQGHLNIESQPGQGATFNIYFPPLAAPPAEPKRTVSAVKPVGNGEIILLAEDDPNVRDATEAMLNYLGYQVIPAANGQEALKLFEAHQTTIDLVLSDVIMPDIGGEELLHRLKAKKPALKMVLMSGYPLTAKDPKLSALGISWFLKPISFERLSRIINQTLQNKIGRWD